MIGLNFANTYATYKMRLHLKLIYSKMKTNCLFYFSYLGGKTAEKETIGGPLNTVKRSGQHLVTGC